MSDLQKSDAPAARSAGGADGGGWGPARSVRSASYGKPPAAATAGGAASGSSADGLSAGGWSTSSPKSARKRGFSGASGSRGAASDASAAAGDAPQQLEQPLTGQTGVLRRRGTSAVRALLVLVVITAVGCLIDVVRGQQLAGGFNIASILGAIVAILLVRRRSMFPIVVSPPIVYSLGAGVFLYLRSSGLKNHQILIDAAANWLVYGFPAVAAATAAVLIIAGVRLIAHR